MISGFAFVLAVTSLSRSGAAEPVTVFLRSSLHVSLRSGVSNLAPVATVQGSNDPLSRAYARWIKDYASGKIKARSWRKTLKKPYLSPKLRDSVVGEVTGRFTRLKEATKLFRLLRRRGTTADGKRLLRIITTGLKKKGGRPWEVGGRFWLMRRACVEVVSGKDCPEAIQTVFFDRVKAGMKEPKKEGDPWDHSDPAAAEVLIPILGSFKTPSFRTTLENLTKVKRSEVQTAAAVALGRMGSGKSIALVANVLSNLKYQEEIIAVADSLAVLVESRSPEPKDRDLKAALSIVLRRIEEWKDWRARYALMPMTRRIRSKSSIPVLIRVLEEAKASKGKIHVSGTLFTAIEESLADLTGFWAPAKEPEKWRSWWTGVASEFVMAPPKKALRSRLNKTKSVGFFGIPVTGNRVVFILDVSGSMLCPLGQVFEQSKMPYTGVTNSRMNKAKEELIAAVNGMTADDRFNVVLFESSVKVWQKKLVPATPKNKKALEGYVKKIKAWGGTALYDGLDKALNIQEQRKKGARYGEPVDEIFLLSDGQPNQGQVVDPAEILDFVTNWNKGAMVRIHTVFLGTGRDPPSPGIPQDFMKPVDLMKAIAKANNGRFKQS